MTQKDRDEFEKWTQAWSTDDRGIGRAARLGVAVLAENQRMRELLVEMAANMDFRSWPETLKEIESFLAEPAQ